MIEQDLEYHIAKLSLKAGDVLVLRLNGRITSETEDLARKHLTPHLPEGVKALVIDESVDLQVLSAEEIEKRI